MDIGLLASYARTALTEVFPDEHPGPPVEHPDELARWERARRTSHAAEKGDVSDWTSIADAYVLDILDTIIGITDPVDDERELARCADSLEILGGHIERIREQLAGEDGPLGGGDDTVDVSQGITRALDTLDEVIVALREQDEEAIETALACEDCDLNGEDCPEHGEARRLARRAAMSAPEAVIRALRDAGLIETTTERG